MRHSITFCIAALILSLATLPLAAADEYKPRVEVAIDAPPVLRAMITRGLSSRFRSNPDIIYVSHGGDWKLSIVAFHPDENDGQPRRFTMSVAFIQRVLFTDPAVVASLEKSLCVTPAGLAQAKSSQRIVDLLYALSAQEGTMDELNATLGEVFADFDKVCIQPVAARKKR
ncbi:MAG TPA: hypothetical protein VMT00_14580 [Thermoanaerobaculia bacterium]|nr:hypothetical protein [Thermoanaerobaculia bacterium]